MLLQKESGYTTLKTYILYMLLILFFLTGCNNKDSLNETMGSFATDTIVSETAAGDYILRLVSDKIVYEVGDEVRMEAKVKYIGEKEKTSIQLGESLFLFDIRENTRGIHLPYKKVEMPSFTTELERNSWYSEVYDKKEAHSNGSDEESEEFLKEFIDLQGFPVGEYEIEVTTNFFTQNEQEQREDHIYSTSLIVEVVD
ncbi:hypothetical protein ACERII_09625 [Evansella sp. AB-rgal1]|uniref:hypothetical protein n=1 Tax=Evansella sp. AB-rgal1 TaxID=3242696 RepID=UPI00359EFB3E